MTGAATHIGPVVWCLKVMLFVGGFSLGAGLALYLVSPYAAITGFLLHTGLLALMATPGLRIFVAVAEWIRRRDFRFVAVAGLVVLELALTIWFAEHINP